MPRDLSSFFCPKSIAVIGASRDPNKVGAIVLRNVIDAGYKGVVYPINPNADNLNGLKCYKDLDAISEIPDLCIVSLPAEQTLATLQKIAQKGTKNVVIYAAGFKETGEQGKQLEEQVKTLAEKNQLNILGPNCLGFINNTCLLNTTFATTSKESDKLKFISQSGAIASSIFDWAGSIGLGFSEFITLGNKVDINENDILNYFKTQSDRSPADHFPIGMYLESISNGPEFLKIVSELSKNHPIFIIKPGKTLAAANAMKSHTGSLAGSDEVFNAVINQTGVVRCDSLEDFFDLAKTFSWGTTPLGPNIAVISNAGGPGVITADAISLSGLKLAEFDDKTKQDLAKILPRTASIIDPVDIMGDALAERFGTTSEIIIQNVNVDSLLFIITPQLMTQIEKTAEYISYLAGKYGKPIYCSFIGGKLVAQGEEILNKNKIPSYRFPERAIYAVSTIYKHKVHMDKLNEPKQKTAAIELPQEGGEIRAIIQKAVNEKYTTLDNLTADTLIKSMGINTPPTKIVCDYNEALEFTKQVGFPVVLKISANGLLHKNELGGVITGIHDEKTLDDGMHKMERKMEQLPASQLRNIAIQIQKGVVGGIEVIVGIKTDPTFGPVLMFGAGGSLVELIDDINLHLLPMDIADAKKLVEKSKLFKTLQGTTIENVYALDKLYDLIVRVSKIPRVIPEAEEVEINPVIITLNDIWAVDTKVVMKQAQTINKPSGGPNFKTAKLVEHLNPAAKFNHFKFETDVPLDFEPGQYISTKVAETAIRSYSFATRYDNKHFDLLVDTRPAGIGSQFLENLKPGDRIQFMGPFGKFVYCPTDTAETLIFCATGSGTSAIRCIIDTILQEKGVTKPIKFYFGLTVCEEIFWQDHFDELAKKYPNFSYEIAINKPNDSWKGAKGFITELIKKDFPDASKCAAYLCGHRAMISDVCDILTANGMPQERIYTERFI